MNMSFAELASVCRIIAEEIGTMIKVDDYRDYGWGRITFMTDPFGGDYLAIRMDTMNGEATYDLAREPGIDGRSVKGVVEIVDLVRSGNKSTKEERNLEGLYQMINEQY